MKKHKKFSFNSILKDLNYNPLATGTTIVNPRDHSLVFKSDFVPLYTIGTPLIVYRLHNNKEVHKFVGKVYISDKKLLKLIELEDILLPGSENCYSSNINFQAVAKYCLRKQNIISRFTFNNKNKSFNFLEIEIIKMDCTQLTFKSSKITFPSKPNFFPKKNSICCWDIRSGDRLEILLSSPLPTLNLSVEISQCLFLGESPSYQCEIIGISNNDMATLKDFLWHYNLKHNQVF